MPGIPNRTASTTDVDHTKTLQKGTTPTAVGSRAKQRGVWCRLISTVKILHPYGSLGPIFEGSSGRVPFAPTDLDIITTAEGIRTFSESSICAEEIGALTERTETIVFLGFGFHDQNVALFDIAQDRMAKLPIKRVFATTMGMSASDEEVVKSQLSYALTGRPSEQNEGAWISTKNGTCAELFATYWRSLTA